MENKRTARIVAIMLAILMVFGGMFSPMSELGVSKVYAATTHTAATWGDLETAVGAASDGDVIEITADLVADHSIEVNKKITIQGGAGGPFTVYQKQRDTYDSMFIVDGGDLTLGANLTLSGQVVECTDGTKTLDDFAIILDREEPGDAEPDTIEESDGTGTFTFSEGNLGVSGMYVLKDDNTYPFTVSGGYLKVNVSGTDYYVESVSNGNYIMRTSLDASKALTVRDASQSMVTPTDGEEVYIYDANFNGFLGWGGNVIVSQNGGNTFDASDAIKFTYHANKTTYYVVPGTTTPKYTDKNDSALQAAMVTYNENHPKTVQKPGWKIDGVEFLNPDDQTAAEAALAAYNAANQTCDTKCPNSVGSDGAYTKDSFNGDIDAYNPKGFFVHVTSGKATLYGATLTNFITNRNKDKAPKFVAPVVATGPNASFDVESGTIKNNIVGYIVDDSMANKSANQIKNYIKGAAPNAARKGDYATRQYRRNSKAGIDGNDPGSGITATAGAIIYASGAKGEISAGDIGFNRGDTGGIMATGEGTEVTLKNNAYINNNVGVQFGGGVTTEDGGAIIMSDGNISNNVAWFGGGGVYATENGVRWLLGKLTLDERKDGVFQMFDGTIEGNTAFTRGGGFFVDSDGVSLFKGTIANNLSHMLGGGMYVMGDDANFTYTVYINKGYVHENKAVSAGPKTDPYQDADNKELSKLLTAPNGCAGVTDLFPGYMTVNSDDINDGYPNPPSDASDGTGGGIWLCAYGNTVLNVGDDSFVIDKNYATGSFRHGKAAQNNEVPEGTSSDKAGGNDIHKETKGSGNIVIFGIQNDSVKWYDENTGDWYTDPANAKNGAVTDFSLKNLVNKGDHEPGGSYDPATYEGVDVYGNMSRRGGGLAADGTFFFGNFRALGEAYSELAVTKTWAGGTQPEEVTIRISLEYKDGDTTKVLPVIELPLGEDAVDSSELDTVFTEGSKVDADGNKVYMGHIVLPITVTDENGKEIQLFDLVSDVDGRIFSLDTADGLYELGQYLKNGGPGGTPGTVSLSTMNRKLVYEELVDDGEGNLVKAAGFEITPSSMRLSTNPPPDIRETEIKQLQTGGNVEVVGSMITSDIRFEADLYNDKPSEIDKYVNKAVHKDIKLDEVFEYDVIAYVKHGTDRLIIEDQLVDDLEFVSTEANVEVVALDENNHLPKNDIAGEEVNTDASVAEAGTAVTNKKVEISDDNKLTVTIENKLDEVKDVNGNVIGYKNAADGQDLTELWGKWVKVTYQVQIKEELQRKIEDGDMRVRDLKSVTVSGGEKYKADPSIFDDDPDVDERPEPNVGNDPVKSDETHTGIDNTASYTLEVKNEAVFRDESNTVTVKPETPAPKKFDIPVEKNWNEFAGDSSKRPTSITIRLLENGVYNGKSMTLTEKDSWKGVFRDLPKTDTEENKIEYTIEEEAVEYYYADILWTDTTYKVTNHTRPWIPRLPSTPGNIGHVKVTKTVSGAAEANKDYEFEATFTYKDGSTYTHTFKLNPTTSPEFVFDYIPVGTVVEVKEKTTGYNTTCKTDGKDATNLTVEVGKTHEVVFNNDKPGESAPTGDNSNVGSWMILLTLAFVSAIAMAYRGKLSR